MSRKTREKENPSLNPELDMQLRQLKIYPKIKSRILKDSSFSDVLNTSYSIVSGIVESRKDSVFTIEYEQEPYMWAILYIVRCDCNHDASLNLWKELSDAILDQMRYSEKVVSEYLQLIRLEVISKEQSWEWDSHE